MTRRDRDLKRLLQQVTDLTSSTVAARQTVPAAVIKERRS